jgi:hypothetical protein
VRIEIESGPGGTRLIVLLGEVEGRELNAGLESESRQWQTVFRDRVKEAGTLNGLRQMEAALATSREELAELAQTEASLREERRKGLEVGSSSLSGIEKKLAGVLASIGMMKGRITELQTLVAQRTTLAGAEISELQSDVMQEFYLAQEKEKAETQAAFFAVAGDLVTKMVRQRKLSESRGRDMQRWRRVAGDGLNDNIVRQLLAEPVQELAEATM